MTKPVKIHFLHIGKTGGSAVKSVLEKYTSGVNYELTIHNHHTPFDNIPVGEKVVFFLREPKSRFVSGFYSRQRKGQPRYNVEWTDIEAKVFSTFSTPNQLANSLADKNSKYFNIALMALENIQHFKRYDYWYIKQDYFKARVEDILYIGFQETLDSCFDELKSILNIPSSAFLPTDDFGAHKNLKELDRNIDLPGCIALESWYKTDIEFISYCKELTFTQGLKM